MRRATASPRDIEAAARCLEDGGLVAFPTETVYGLGADASNPHALDRIFAVKGRPRNHPLIVHIPGIAHIEAWGREVPALAWRLAERFWPGPLTIIVKRSPDVLDAVTGGQDTVGLRVPNHPVALELLASFGGGIAAPSANRFGHVSPTSAEAVIADLGDDVDMVIDGGACAVGIESTILDLSGARPRVLRPGMIGAEALSDVLEEAPGGSDEGAPRAPGALESHYSPKTPLTLARSEEVRQVALEAASAGQLVAVLARGGSDLDDASVRWFAMPADPAGYAHDLYATLRAADAEGCDLILVETPPSDVGWEAILDRLTRAAAPARGCPAAVRATASFDSRGRSAARLGSPDPKGLT